MEVLNFVESHWHIVASTIGAIMMGITFWFKHMVWNPIRDNKKNLERQNQNYNTKFDETHSKMDALHSELTVIGKDTAENKGMLQTLIKINER